MFLFVRTHWTSFFKARIHLIGSINKQTIRYWLADKPIELHLNLFTVLDTPARMQLTAGTVVVGPSFFDEDGAGECKSEPRTLCYKGTQFFAASS